MKTAEVMRVLRVSRPTVYNYRVQGKLTGKMMQNGFKMEVEAMINKRLTYLTEEYVPMKIKDSRQWLD